MRALLSDHAVYIHSSGLVDDEITYLPPLENKDVCYTSIEMEVFRRPTADGHAAMTKSKAKHCTEGARPQGRLFLAGLFISAA